MPSKTMIIVESKAKTDSIGKMVGDQYLVRYCLGHIYDLPRGSLGIDVEKDFQPKYEQITGKQKLIGSLKTDAKQVDTVILATDPDREGESIAWHLARLFPDKKLHRMKFNEITRRAIMEALQNMGDINLNLVDAQQARRIVDRLVGYQISPLLWKTLKGKLSAGRVQSVAVRLVCEREKEIKEFKPEEYWSLWGQFESESGREGSKLAVFTAKYYGSEKEALKIGSQEEADRMMERLRKGSFKVKGVNKKQDRRRPLAPYITSSLQQDASRRLGFGASKTMAIAQQLYEGVETGGSTDAGPVGLITYMRTDSTRISQDAAKDASDYLAAQYGREYLPEKPNVFKSKSKASAQDAHEAVRPTYVALAPHSLKGKLTSDQFKLYDLIWKRFLASQAAPALVEATSIDLSDGEFMFRLTGSIVLFDGFMRIFAPEEKQKSDDDEENDKQNLPPLKAGDPVNLLDLTGKQHFTKPPPRYTEASLIRTLEENGIGRPSTYAPTLETIRKRKYATLVKQTFYPTKWGMIVNDLLTQNFQDVVDYDFTARLENSLDAIETGESKWLDVVKDFYSNFSKTLQDAEKNMKYEEKVDEKCPECGTQMMVRAGRYGIFLGCSNYPTCKFTKPYEYENGAEEGVPEGASGKAKPAKTPPQPTDKTCSKCGKPMLLREGRYGKFLACSGFPKCRNIEAFIGDFNCPKENCDGKITKKVSKKKRGFYGCAKYPECDFVSWYAPLEENCPKCGKFLVDKSTKKSERKACVSEECGYLFEAPRTETQAEDDADLAAANS